MKVENSIAAASFEDLNVGDAFAFELSGQTHLCMKVLEERPNGNVESCLSFFPGYAGTNHPEVFHRDVVEAKGKVARLSSVVFRTSSDPDDIDLYEAVSPTPGLVLVRNDAVFLCARANRYPVLVNMGTGEISPLSHHEPTIHIKKWSLVSRIGDQETTIFSFPPKNVG